MENRTGKYLKYAIGEIVLVVIGILIALQINNWNEKRNQNKELSNYLKSLNEEIDTNIDIIQNGINRAKFLKKTSEYYQYKFITIKPEIINDSVITNFVLKINPIRVFKPTTIILKDLISSGQINNIEDLSLKKNILLLESKYNSYISNIIESDERYIRNIESHLNLYSDYSKLMVLDKRFKIKEGNFKHVRSGFINNRVLSNNLLFYIAMLATIENKSKGQIEYLKKLRVEITKAQQWL